jgi:RNA polymerase sigma factor (sigma-70 family)
VNPNSDAEVYATNASDLVRFATALVGPADAPDVVSGALVRVLASGSWAYVQDRRAYLFRAVLNEARMHHRSTLRRRAREARVAIVDLTRDDERDVEVLERVARLSVRQRAVVMLTYWNDLAPHAIAALLGISEGSVRKHLARAHARLKESLDDVRDA